MSPSLEEPGWEVGQVMHGDIHQAHRLILTQPPGPATTIILHFRWTSKIKMDNFLFYIFFVYVKNVLSFTFSLSLFENNLFKLFFIPKHAQYYTMILRLESVVSIASLKCNAIYVYNGTTDLYCKNVVAFKTCRFLMQKKCKKQARKNVLFVW